MNNLTKLFAAAALCALSSAASAVPILGSIAFGAAPGASWTPTGGTGIADATGVQFNPATSGFVAQVTSVGSGPNDYAGTIGADVTFNNFTFSPLTPPAQLWSFVSGANTYTFDMTSVNIELQNAGALTLSGNGLDNITGFDQTDGTWRLSLDSVSSVFSFSSTASAAPEPGLALLLGTGLIGFGVARKMRKTA